MTSALNRIRIAVAIGVALCCLTGPAAASAAQVPNARSVLFSLDAGEGSLVPVKGKRGTFTLTLRKVDGRALAFDDRPGRKVGTIRVQKMIDKLFVAGQAAPNAAVNAELPDGEQALMGVELGAPRYSAKAHTLRFRVRQLTQEAGAAPDSRVDTVLPRRFGDTALFIDNCCQPPTEVSVFNTSVNTVVVSVNNGAQFVIGGTGPNIGWGADWPAQGGPSWNPQAPPEPNVLGPGNNYLAILPEGGVTPSFVQINIPSDLQVRSLQLYLFFNASGTPTVTVLNNGVFVASSS